MEDSAFSGCDEEKICIDNSELVMGKNAFAYSDKVEEISIKNSTLEIDEYAFYNNGDDAVVQIDGCSVSIDNSGLSGNSFETLKLVNCTKLEIGNEGIAYSDDLENLTISGRDMSFGEYVLYNDDKLIEFSIDAGEGEIKLEDSAFSGVSKDFETANIKCKEIEIGDEAFAYNKKLKSVIIEGALKKAGKYIFYNADDSISITIGGEKYSVSDFQK